jgi:hypothetical protein
MGLAIDMVVCWERRLLCVLMILGHARRMLTAERRKSAGSSAETVTRPGSAAHAWTWRASEWICLPCVVAMATPMPCRRSEKITRGPELSQADPSMGFKMTYPSTTSPWGSAAISRANSSGLILCVAKNSYWLRCPSKTLLLATSF